MERTFWKAQGGSMRMLSLAFLLITLINNSFADTLKASSTAREGKNLHARTIARYPKLDKIYQQPTLWGGLTDSPVVQIHLPTNAWNKMTEKERDLLVAYVSSLIPMVKANPMKYAGISSDAPAAQRIISNAQRMTDKSWQIITGHLSSDGRDIINDSIVRSGNPADVSHR